MSEEKVVDNKYAKYDVVLTKIRESVTSFFANFSKTTAETFAWISIIVMLSATVPSLLAVKTGISDKLPSLDLVILTWIGLLLYFVRSAILKDMLMVVTIGFGFAIQAILLGFIFFQ